MLKKLKHNNKAISEVLGTILLLLISVTLFSVVYVTVLSTDASPQAPSVNLIGTIKADEIILKHAGGKALPLGTQIIFRNFDNSESSKITVDQNDYMEADSKDDGKWNIGENFRCPIIDVIPSYQANDLIYVYVIDIISNSVIMEGQFRAGVVTSGTPLVQLSNPVGGETLEDDVTILWTANDAEDGSNLDISLYICAEGDSTWYPIASNPIDNTGSYLWDTTSESDGNYQIKVVAEDSDSNIGEGISNTFTIQNIGTGIPQVSITYPDGSTVQDTITITWSATDLEDGTNLDISLYIRPDGGAWESIASNPIANTGSYLWDTNNKDDGNYQIKVVAEDSDSNIGEDISPIFEINNIEEFTFTDDIDVASAGSTISICGLNPTCFVVGYGVNMGDSSSGNGYAAVRVGLVTGSEIAYGPEYTFLSTDWGVDIVKLARLDGNSFIMTYPKSGLSEIYAIKGTVSGNTISFSTGGDRGIIEPSGFNTNTGYTIDVLSSSRFAIAFYEETASFGTLEMDIGEIEGNKITFNNNYKIDLDEVIGHPIDRPGYVKVAGLDNTHYVISYSYISGDHTYAASRIYEIYEPEPCDPACIKDPMCQCPIDEGGTSTMGSEYTFAGLGADNAYVHSICALDGSHFVVKYKEGIVDKTIVGTVSGTDISYSNPSGSVGDGFPICVTKLDSTHFIAAGPWGEGPGKVKMGTISGDIISPSSTYQFRDETTAYVDVSRLDSQRFVVAFKDITGHGFQGYQFGPGKVMVLSTSIFG